MEILELKQIQNRENIEHLITSLEAENSHQSEEEKCSQLSENYNSYAIILLNENKVQESLEYLRKAESLSYNNPVLRSFTYNTIASFYRRQGKTSTALKYIERSISIHPSGQSYLNLCSILNSQGKYDKALEIAMHAIIFLLDELFELSFEGKTIKNSNFEVLSAAYYNLAVSLDYLKRSDEASSYYKKAVEFSEKYLTDNNPVKEVIRQIYDRIIAGSLKKFEKIRKTEISGKNLQNKKRVIIKASSKSPLSKTPENTGKKIEFGDKIKNKKNRNSLSHRKFVKSGITKAKLIESFIPAPEGESSGDEIVKNLASTQVFSIKKDEDVGFSLKKKLRLDKSLHELEEKNSFDQSSKNPDENLKEYEKNEQKIENEIKILEDDEKDLKTDKFNGEEARVAIEKTQDFEEIAKNPEKTENSLTIMKNDSFSSNDIDEKLNVSLNSNDSESKNLNNIIEESKERLETVNTPPRHSYNNLIPENYSENPPDAEIEQNIKENQNFNPENQQESNIEKIHGFYNQISDTVSEKSEEFEQSRPSFESKNSNNSKNEENKVFDKLDSSGKHSENKTNSFLIKNLSKDEFFDDVSYKNPEVEHSFEKETMNIELNLVNDGKLEDFSQNSSKNSEKPDILDLNIEKNATEANNLPIVFIVKES